MLKANQGVLKVAKNGWSLRRLSLKYGALIKPLAAVIGFLTATPALASTTIVLSPLEPQMSNINLYVVSPWIKEVAKVTDGQVIIKMLPMDIAPPDQLAAAVQNGIVDAAYFYNVLAKNKFPLVQIGSLPFLSSSSEGSSIALWNTYQKYFPADKSYKHLKLLALYCQSHAELYSEGHPFSSLADMEGQKILSLPGPTEALLADSGIAVQTAPAVQMSEFITSGTVNGIAGLDPVSLADFKLTPYMKSVTKFPRSLGTGCFSLVVNKDKWDSIPAKYQAKIEKISGVEFAKRLRFMDNLADSDFISQEKSGIKIVVPNSELMATFQKAADKQYAEWIKMADSLGVNGQAAIDYYKAQLKLFAEKQEQK